MEVSKVLENIDNKMYMKDGDWLEEVIASNQDVTIIDFRGEKKVKEEAIKGTIQVDIRDLPKRKDELFKSKDELIVCVCNGSIQSAMAVVYLRSEDYTNCWNLSGGFSSWKRNNREIVSQN